MFSSARRETLVIPQETGDVLHSAAKVPLCSYFISQCRGMWEEKGLECSWEGCGLLGVSWAGSSPFLGMKLLSASWVRAVAEILGGGGLSQDTGGALALIWGISRRCSYPGEGRYLLS